MNQSFRFVMKFSYLLIIIGFALPACAQELKKQTADSLEVVEIDDSTFTLITVGDIMMGTNFPDASYLPPAGTYLLDPLKEILKSGDVTFGNLEGTILNEGGELKSCSDWTKCYAFRQPDYFASEIKDAGFDILSVANNHLGDFGATGRKNTMKVLDEHGFTFTVKVSQGFVS